MNSETTPTNAKGDAALVLFSGGQDSTTCLAYALKRFGRVETIGFDYGQRHAVELDRREVLRSGLAAMSPLWRERLGADHVVSLPALGEISQTALTRETEIAFNETGLPNTFVPGRNIVFLTFAAALAYRRGVSHLVGGMCETDYSGYPDCRDATIRATENALSLGMDREFAIHTPLMWIDKADTWRLAEKLGGEALVRLIIEETHTCYLGERGRRFDWGYGCGECPACRLRAAGWEKYAREKAASPGLRP
ncbi:7-cyano-7-deazaguanine synthase QueC [Methylocystis heyeri]|uniref:7-cyano-7-deazaguanine synthase n=1 Tax=Methylocystis heyeri TaxID=391905 RepID=A0A6B8KD83_9HYPH|nr:7-cyano-7-deazaguanine synthase QueC [Methylocystis heyeri]QGM45542.1 7-cyano-7-deazaguanine synthase QueC [Methylocystis heyeri]